MVCFWSAYIQLFYCQLFIYFICNKLGIKKGYKKHYFLSLFNCIYLADNILSSIFVYQLRDSPQK